MRKIGMAAALLAATATTTAYAAVNAEEAKQLGTTLTVWGAEKAGNKEGTIPAYSDEAVKVPSSYDPKDPYVHPDPFNDKPLYSITAQNLAQYGDKLTDAMKAMFKAYPNYRMDIYPTRRTNRFPKYVLDNTLKNAASCKAVDNELVLEGCYGGIPFPIPKTGNQVMWNHLTQFEAHAWEASVSNYLVAPSGSPVLQAIAHCQEEVPYYDPAKTAPHDSKITFWRVRCDDLAPARRVGQKLVLIDSLDQLNVGRRAYQYIPGQRRVKLAPDLSYDTPNLYTGGASTMDDSKGFLGALDRFDWKLLGKQEKYIMYNNFALHDYKGGCSDTKIHATKNFANPDCVRWELHRVWVVEAKRKPNFRHVYARRVFYYDEDGYGVGHSEAYDAGGRLFRVTTVMHQPMYEGRGQSGGTTFSMDLQTGIWASNGVAGCEHCGWTIRNKPFGDVTFSPEALAGEGVR